MTHSASRQGNLPTDTPPLVKRYLEQDGQLEHADFLRFDEMQTVAAFHAWAIADGHATATLQRLADAFLNRKKIYAAVKLPSDATAEIALGKMLGKLPAADDEHTPTWVFDKSKNNPYKGFIYGATRSMDGEEDSANRSILLADPADPDSGSPVEASSTLLRAFDGDAFVLNRLYFDHDRREDFLEIADTLNLQLPENSP